MSGGDGMKLSKEDVLKSKIITEICKDKLEEIVPRLKECEKACDNDDNELKFLMQKHLNKIYFFGACSILKQLIKQYDLPGYIFEYDERGNVYSKLDNYFEQYNFTIYY